MVPSQLSFHIFVHGFHFYDGSSIKLCFSSTEWLRAQVLESNRPAFQFQHRHCVIWNKLLNCSIPKISFAKQGYYLPHKNYFILDNLCMAVSKDSINGDTVTPQCQFILFNLNPPIMVNIFKWFSIIYGKHTKKALPSPHVLVPHCTVLLLTCCVENIQETGFSINYYLFPVGILRREKHSLGYHGVPFTSKKVLDTTHKQKPIQFKTGQIE